MPTDTLSVSIDDVRDAQKRIAGKVRHTPILRGDKLDSLVDAQVYFKPENLQITGSFKIRGAMNKILTLSDDDRSKGIIASSSGNHAQGVAYASKMLGAKAILVLPENAPQTKIDGTKALGAEVVLYGFDSVQRYKKLYELKAQNGYTLVHSYNDPALIAGQGTSGLEIAEDLPEVNTVVVPLGGGGLLAGVAAALKESKPGVRVVGVEPVNIPRYSESRKTGKPVEVPMGPTLADGLMITQTGEHNYPLIEKYVDEIVTASDPFIRRALTEIVFKGKVLAEPSAAIGLAAALEGTFKVRPGERICFYLSGGNIDPDKLLMLIK
ncbi:MAG: pyridoxal-phosphate dependent enzyme [Synergistaceae bacterium]|jgi:threonine dehydratase|nr:pyridoxal-phosphate dependent enzyme [Synergistaceae bacterium]